MHASEANAILFQTKIFHTIDSSSTTAMGRSARQRLVGKVRKRGGVYTLPSAVAAPS